MFTIYSAHGQEGVYSDALSADAAAHKLSEQYHAATEVQDSDGSVVTRHYAGQKVVQKLSFGFTASQPSAPEYKLVPYEASSFKMHPGFALAA